MIRLLLLSILGIFGYNDKPEPVRLAKNDNTKVSIRTRMEGWCIRHSSFCLLVLLVTLSLLFALLCFAILNVTMDSGNYYYHLKDVI